MTEFIDMDVVSLEETVLRVFCALLFGLVLGYERDAKNKPIDFRAYMIVAVTTCVVAIMGQELYQDYSSAENVVSVDMAKIIAGVLTGIGFLGAGAIIKVSDDQIVGTATGASVWAAGGIGLCLGFGMYALSFVAFVAIAAILVIGGFAGKYVHHDKKESVEK